MTKRTNIAPKASTARKLKWAFGKTLHSLHKWRHSRSADQRELKMYRRAAHLEQKLETYPRAVPILNELMHIHCATHQESRRLETMRRLRDITPQPAPDFIWDDQIPVKVFRNNLEAWCAKVENMLSSRHCDSIHFDHIRNYLAISLDNAKCVCSQLEMHGIIGEYNRINGR